MGQFLLPVMAQVCLALGLAGLLWPEKFAPVFDVLMFPWASSDRIVRLNGIAAIALSGFLLLAWTGHF
jgi:hypothetical protein